MPQNYIDAGQDDNLVDLKWHQKGWGKAVIIFLVILLLLLVGAVWLFIGLMKEVRENQEHALRLEQMSRQLQIPDSDVFRVKAEKSGLPSLGAQDAKLVIVEFSDFQCPKCAVEFPIIRQIVDKYQDKVRFIYRHFPIYDGSLLLSQASWCAYEQDKFWSVHDRLFLNQGKINTQEDVLRLIGQSGVDLNQFNQCMQEEKYKDQVIIDAQDGVDLGVKGTPTFFINGNRIAGVIPEADWEEIINQALEILY